MKKYHLIVPVILALMGADARASDPNQTSCLKLNANDKSGILSSVAACCAWRASWKKNNTAASLKNRPALNNAITDASIACGGCGGSFPAGEKPGLGNPKCIPAATKLAALVSDAFKAPESTPSQIKKAEPTMELPPAMKIDPKISAARKSCDDKRRSGEIKANQFEDCVRKIMGMPIKVK
jgi:hypothetical protein